MSSIICIIFFLTSLLARLHILNGSNMNRLFLPTLNFKNKPSMQFQWYLQSHWYSGCNWETLAYIFIKNYHYCYFALPGNSFSNVLLYLHQLNLTKLYKETISFNLLISVNMVLVYIYKWNMFSTTYIVFYNLWKIWMHIMILSHVLISTLASHTSVSPECNQYWIRDC